MPLTGWSFFILKKVHSVALFIMASFITLFPFCILGALLYSLLSSLKAGRVLPLVLYSGETAQCLALSQHWTKLQCVNESAELSWLARNGAQMKVWIF